MWFNKAETGKVPPAKEEAFKDAGNAPLLIDRDQYTDSIPD